VYADSEQITVFYWDEDNDQVHIDSQSELLEAFKVRSDDRIVVNL